MRKASFIAAMVSAPLLFSVSIAGAQQQSGTAAEAKAMLEKAVAAVKADEKAALEKFKKGEGGFKDRDLYVFCFDAESGKFTAHPNEKLMGTDVRALKDKSGDAMGEKIFKAGQTEQMTTVDYMFPKPGGTEPVAKQAFVAKVKDQGCGVGYYK
ncbi:MAG: cache domain-containing protein [Xanthobacteraceae bacterium]